MGRGVARCSAGVALFCSGRSVVADRCRCHRRPNPFSQKLFFRQHEESLRSPLRRDPRHRRCNAPGLCRSRACAGGVARGSFHSPPAAPWTRGGAGGLARPDAGSRGHSQVIGLATHLAIPSPPGADAHPDAGTRAFAKTNRYRDSHAAPPGPTLNAHANPVADSHGGCQNKREPCARREPRPDARGQAKGNSAGETSRGKKPAT